MQNRLLFSEIFGIFIPHQPILHIAKRFHIRPIILCAAVMAVAFSCVMEKEHDNETFERPSVPIDLPEILQKGKLTVLFENSTTSYFIYKEKKMGFEYELLRLFAEEIGLDLEVKVVNNLDNLIDMVNSGEGDLIACNYTITKDRDKIISFSEPFLETHQVLVQRKPDGWEEMKNSEWRENLLKKPNELAGKKIHVWKNSSYYERLLHLQDEIGDSIHIRGVEGMIGGEELIERVSNGIIDYTIIEENVARVNSQFFDNLSTELVLSVDQKMAFGMRKTSHLLKAKLDEWLKKFKKKAIFAHIYRKYFEKRHVSTQPNSSYVTLNGEHISEFDNFFKLAEDKTGWDWRLLAAVAYQESKFNPEALSFGGAYGMMQFMPNTGPSYNVYPDTEPPDQIMGGAMKLRADENYWSMVKDPLQRKKFALASYNSGRGHVLDAQRLAEKHGLNPNVWDDNVEAMLLNLSKQEYYQDEVVRHGMMRSQITYRYVREVTDRYLDWVGTYE
ncbi:MAG: membrane-bound lytic murein transglycosylase F [Crocinitomicaceae bacterium]|jgi:membrane-bound lytic murein transglycosylase F